MWKLNAGLDNFLGAGRAILLQLAHPYVAYAIADHSTTVSDVRKRFQATFENVFGMTFGSRAEAIAKARKVHAVHARIHGILPTRIGRFEAGHRYHANDSDALLWVHATLIGTALHIQKLTHKSRSTGELEELYEASKRFALLFGLDEALVPRSLKDFDSYTADTIAGDMLAVSQPAREMATFIFEAPRHNLRPAFAIYRAITASLLPPRLAEAYGMPCGARERAIAALVLRGAGLGLPRLPEGLRMVPAAMQAEVRLGLRKESRWTQIVERGMQAGLGAWS